MRRIRPLLVALIALLSASHLPASDIALAPGMSAGDTQRPAHHAIPEWVIAGIAAVETGSTYRAGDLLHYRDRRDGADGEVGPWQLAPSALHDLGVSHLRSRIRSEPVLAESMARAWLLQCYRRSGDWLTAVAIYHTGPHGDRRRGRAYAQRVLAAGSAP